MYMGKGSDRFIKLFKVNAFFILSMQANTNIFMDVNVV